MNPPLVGGLDVWLVSDLCRSGEAFVVLLQFPAGQALSGNPAGASQGCLRTEL